MHVFKNCYMSFLLPAIDYVFMLKINETTIFTSEKYLVTDNLTSCVDNFSWLTYLLPSILCLLP
jgi:hypothetical protein